MERLLCPGHLRLWPIHSSALGDRSSFLTPTDVHLFVVPHLCSPSSSPQNRVSIIPTNPHCPRSGSFPFAALCPTSHFLHLCSMPLDILSSEWRELYLFLIPSLVLLFAPSLLRLLGYILPRQARKYLIDLPYEYLGPCLTLDEIYEPNERATSAPAGRRSKKGIPLWKLILLVSGSLLQAGFWLGRFAWISISSSYGIRSAWPSLVLGLCWAYASLLPMLSTRPTPHTSVVLFYAVAFLASTLTFLTTLYEYSLLPPIPHGRLLSDVTIARESASLVLNAFLIGLSLTLPMQSVPQGKTHPAARTRFSSLGFLISLKRIAESVGACVFSSQRFWKSKKS